MKVNSEEFKIYAFVGKEGFIIAFSQRVICGAQKAKRYERMEVQEFSTFHEAQNYVRKSAAYFTKNLHLLETQRLPVNRFARWEDFGPCRKQWDEKYQIWREVYEDGYVQPLRLVLLDLSVPSGKKCRQIII